MRAVLDILRRPKLLRGGVISLIEQSVECLDYQRFVGFLLRFHNSDFVKDVLFSDLLDVVVRVVDIPFWSRAIKGRSVIRIQGNS